MIPSTAPMVPILSMAKTAMILSMAVQAMILSMAVQAMILSLVVQEMITCMVETEMISMSSVVVTVRTGFQIAQVIRPYPSKVGLAQMLFVSLGRDPTWYLVARKRIAFACPTTIPPHLLVMCQCSLRTRAQL